MRNVAHFIWVGDPYFPLQYQKCYNSFVKKHPYYRINLWFQSDIDKIVEGSKYKKYFHKYNSFINRYNFVKYHILAEYGGWFVDMDIEWKLSLDNIMFDKVKGEFPQMFIPVRKFLHLPELDIDNDDMLIYADKGLFWELIEFAVNRTDIGNEKYEPFGPVSLSRWLQQVPYTREYMYEREIQSNGYYCNHLNGQSWRFS